MGNMSIDDIIKQADKIKNEANNTIDDASTKINQMLDDAKNDIKSSADEALNFSSNDDIQKFDPSNNINKVNDDKTTVIPKVKDNVTDKTIKITLKGNEVPVNKATDKTIKINNVENTRIISEDEMKKINHPSINKSSYISTNSELDDETDLKEMPTLVSVNKLDKTFNYTQNNNVQEELGFQMTLEGFDDEIATVAHIDEEKAQIALNKNREEKINKFRLFGPSETDKDLNQEKVVDNDYVNKADKENVLISLNYSNNKAKTKIIITIILEIFLAFITAFKDKSFFPAFLNEHTTYFATALIIYISILLTNFNIILHGLKIKNGFKFDFITATTSLIVLIHSIILTISENLWYDNGILLSCVASFALLISQIGKYTMINRIIDNFEYLTSDRGKYTIENIANEIDSSIICRGIIDEKPIIKTSVKTDFPTDFLDISCKTEPADKIANPLGFIMFGLSFLLFLIIGIKDNFNTAFNIFVCCICSSNPIIAIYATNKALNDITKYSAKKGARICGYEGAQVINNSNVMVMEAADFFDNTCCDKHGFKTFNNTKIDDAILYTAAVMIKTKSPLSHVFDDIIIGKKSILPEVKDIIYENKMGTSAWIYGQKVLVGNRELLIAHGVTVPKEEFEQRYTKKDKHALYLAVNGTICAMFIFSYSANPILKQELKKLEKSGITILVRSCDPYINEEELCRLFDLPNDFIKVMNPSSAKVYEKYSNMIVDKSPSYVIHDGTALSFVSAMKSAEDLIASKKLIKFLCTFGSAIGFIIITFLALTNEYSQITAMGCLSFHIIWSIFVIFVTKVNKLLF